LSKLLFNSEFESDMNQWNKISIAKINNAASLLYKSSEEILQKDSSLTEVI